MSVPFQSTRPALGWVMVAKMRISVDFPAPFGPSRPSTPGRSSKRKLRKASVFPRYVLLTFSISSFMSVSVDRWPPFPLSVYFALRTVAAAQYGKWVMGQSRSRLSCRRAPRAKGKKFGRPRVEIDAARVAELRRDGLSWSQVCRALNVSKGSAQRSVALLPEEMGAL